MNYKQFLYMKLAEEASEVAQAALKCSIFGEEGKDPRQENSNTNLEHLNCEINDLYAILSLINELHNPDHQEGQYPIDPNEVHIRSKMKNVRIQFNLHKIIHCEVEPIVDEEREENE